VTVQKEPDAEREFDRSIRGTYKKNGTFQIIILLVPLSGGKLIRLFKLDSKPKIMING